MDTPLTIVNSHDTAKFVLFEKHEYLSDYDVSSNKLYTIHTAIDEDEDVEYYIRDDTDSMNIIALQDRSIIRTYYR